MTLDALIMLAGAFVAALPFLGFPRSWDTVLFVIAGFIVIALGIVVRRRGLGERPRAKQGDTYVESEPHQDTAQRS
jgi:hypothetical protein